MDVNVVCYTYTRVYFRVRSKLGKIIRTTETYWIIITAIKHPVMKGKEEEVKHTLKSPERIVLSEKDERVCLYYGSFGKRLVCVVVRHENGTGFIISAYPVDTTKRGVLIYEKDKIVS